MKVLNFDGTIYEARTGSATKPSISFAGDTNTGIYNSGADQLSIATGGVQRLVVDASGNVTIPGALTAGSLSGPSSFSLGSATSPSVYFGTDTNTGIYSPGEDQVAISTNGVGRLFVDANGNVGLGISSFTTHGATQQVTALSGSAASRLSFYNGSTLTGDIVSANFASIGLQLNVPNAYPIQFITNNQERLRITSTGQLSHIGAGSTGSPAVSFNGSAPSNSLVIDSSGRLLVGTSSARSNYFNFTLTTQFQVEGAGSASLTRNLNDEFGGALVLAKSRGTGNTILQNGDAISSITFQGNDSSEFVEAASITAFVDGTPGNNDMPGRLVFSTTADGSASPTERMRITSNGLIRQNLDVPFGYEKANGTYSTPFTITVPASNACWELAIEGSRVSAPDYGSRYQVYHIGSLSGYPRTTWSNAITNVSDMNLVQTSNGPGISVSSAVNGVLTVTMTGSGTLKYSYALRQLNAGTSY